MKLSRIMSLEKNDIVSISGAGGKTSLMFFLSQELRKSHKVLITTSTKIYAPEKGMYDYLVLEESKEFPVCNMYHSSNGVYVIGRKVNEENKLEGISKGYLNNIASSFDYIFIEADGSKRKPVKGWNEFEPVVYENTSKTIGVLDIQVTGKKADESLVHRVDKFLELTSLEENQIIKLEHLKVVVLEENGLFKNALGKRILFINKVEREEDFINAERLAELLMLNSSNYIDRIIIGSLLQGRFEMYVP